jgi:predicted aspartyl protease
MKRIARTALLACAIALGLAFGTNAYSRPQCRIERKAEIPLLMAGEYPLVEVALDGKKADFLLDTGAERTVVADSAVRELGLARDPWVSSGIRGVGGVLERTSNALLRSFEIGGVKLRRHAMSPALSLVVAPLPWGTIGPYKISGLLGADYLSAFDLDLDFPGHMLALYETTGCGADPIPWAPSFGALPLQRPAPYVVLAPLEVDGKTLLAQIDTGAALSLISGKGAARLGITPAMLAHDSGRDIRGIGRQAPLVHNRIVETMQLGPSVFHNVQISFGSLPGLLPFDMLLGMDLLHGQHILLSYATSRLLIAKPAVP